MTTEMTFLAPGNNSTGPRTFFTNADPNSLPYRNTYADGNAWMPPNDVRNQVQYPFVRSTAPWEYAKPNESIVYQPYYNQDPAPVTGLGITRHNQPPVGEYEWMETPPTPNTQSISPNPNYIQQNSYSMQRGFDSALYQNREVMAANPQDSWSVMPEPAPRNVQGDDVVADTSSDQFRPQDTPSSTSQTVTEAMSYTPELGVGSVEANTDVSCPPIVRRPGNIFVSGPDSFVGYQSQSMRFHKINLKLFGDVLKNVHTVPWTNYENLEERRIVRVDRVQEGCTLKAYFTVVEPNSRSHETTIDDQGSLKISCIKFTQMDGTVSYLITSVEAIKIIEYLVRGGRADAGVKWRERGRIRSNLSPLWYKDWASGGMQNEAEMRQRFGDQIRKYKSLKPYAIMKSMRVLLWEKLEFAIFKAILFYCVADAPTYTYSAE